MTFLHLASGVIKPAALQEKAVDVHSDIQKHRLIIKLMNDGREDQGIDRNQVLPRVNLLYRGIESLELYRK